MNHWGKRVQPHLEDFLPEAVRGVARQRIEQHLEAVADGKPKKPNRDRHRNHSYLLKGILRSKQGKYLMTGRVGGKNGKRSYAVSRGTTVPKSNNIFSRRVPAQPLEDAVVSVVREVVRSIPNLQAMIKELIVQNLKSVQGDVENPEQFKKAIQRKQKQLALLTDDVHLEDDDVLTRKCNKIKAEIRVINLRLQQAPKTQQNTPLTRVLTTVVLRNTTDTHVTPHIQIRSSWQRRTPSTLIFARAWLLF